MASIILIHGAWQGSWVWKDVKNELQALGHVIQTPDLAVPPKTESEPQSPATLEAYINRITDAIARAPEPVILVAHSMGGIPATVAATRTGKRVSKLIYLAAFVPCDGDSLLTLTNLQHSEHQLPLIFDDDAKATTVAEDGIIPFFLADASVGCAAYAKSKFTPQPLAPITTPAALDHLVLESISRCYILCSQDRAIEPSLQRLMAIRANCPIVQELASGHCPFISRPQLLSSTIHRLANDQPAEAPSST